MKSFAPILTRLETIADPRRAEGKRYEQRYILLFAILAIVTGADSYPGIHTFIRVHLKRLNKAFGLGWNKPPAHTSIRSILSGLDAADVEAAFRAHAAELGAAVPTALLVAIWNVPAGQAALMEAFTGGWLRPTDLLIWFSPILGGFLGSVWIARATSRTFPSLRARRLFSIPEEFKPPRVICETLEWNSRFRELLPNCENHAEAVSYAVASPQFYARHRPETKVRPHVARRLLPKIAAKSALTDQELMLALGERHCFDALHLAHANAMQ